MLLLSFFQVFITSLMNKTPVFLLVSLTWGSPWLPIHHNAPWSSYVYKSLLTFSGSPSRQYNVVPLHLNCLILYQFHTFINPSLLHFMFQKYHILCNSPNMLGFPAFAGSMIFALPWCLAGNAYQPSKCKHPLSVKAFPDSPRQVVPFFLHVHFTTHALLLEHGQHRFWGWITFLYVKLSISFFDSKV